MNRHFKTTCRKQFCIIWNKTLIQITSLTLCLIPQSNSFKVQVHNISNINRDNINKSLYITHQSIQVYLCGFEIINDYLSSRASLSCKTYFGKNVTTGCVTWKKLINLLSINKHNISKRHILNNFTYLNAKNNYALFVSKQFSLLD